MSNAVFINKEGIIECHVVGDQTTQSVHAMGSEIEKALAKLKAEGKPLLVIDDITQIGKVPAEGGHAVIALAKNLSYDRLAMIGKGGMIRIGANLLIRASGRGRKLRYFDNPGDARAWLQGAKPHA